MKDMNGTSIRLDDYVAFQAPVKGRDIGQVIAIDETQATSNVRVLHVATHEAHYDSGVAGFLRKVGDAFHVHYASTTYITATECELVMLGDGALPDREPEQVKGSADIAKSNSPYETAGIGTTSSGDTTGSAVAPVNAGTVTELPQTEKPVADEPGHDGNGSPVPPVPQPEG